MKHAMYIILSVLKAKKASLKLDMWTRELCGHLHAAALTIKCVIIYLTWPIPSKEQHVHLCMGFLMKVC